MYRRKEGLQRCIWTWPDGSQCANKTGDASGYCVNHHAMVVRTERQKQERQRETEAVADRFMEWLVSETDVCEWDRSVIEEVRKRLESEIGRMKA